MLFVSWAADRRDSEHYTLIDLLSSVHTRRQVYSTAYCIVGVVFSFFLSSHHRPNEDCLLELHG